MDRFLDAFVKVIMLKSNLVNVGWLELPSVQKLPTHPIRTFIIYQRHPDYSHLHLADEQQLYRFDLKNFKRLKKN